jgi:hypothetical protein
LTDITSIEAARARIREERARRLAERIAAGEIISVPLFIVAGSEAEVRKKVEQTTVDKLKELRDTGDQREVSFEITMAVTGVLRPGEAADPASVPTAPSFALREDRLAAPPLPSRLPDLSNDMPVKRNEKEAVPEEPLIEAYICVQTRQCRDDDDAGEVSEGWYSIDGKTVTVTNKSGGYVGSRKMAEGENPKTVARELLREKKVPEGTDFNRRLDYPNAGLP